MKNELLKGLTIEDYTSEGLGVARFEGRVVFVPGTAVGDVCDVKIVKDTGGTLYGIVQEIIKPSPHRTDPGCPVYGLCGGCCFRHVTYGEECRAKRRRVEETMRRIGGFGLAVEGFLTAPSRDCWRNKAAFPVGITGSKAVTGFYRRRSHDICPVTSCAICTSEQNEAAAVLREWIDETGRRDIRHLFVRQGEGGVQVCVTASGAPGSEAQALAEALRGRLPALNGVLWDRHREDGNVILSGNLKTLWGNGRLSDRMCGVSVSLSPLSFYQINKYQAEMLYMRAIEYAGDFDRAVDLYCGAGTLTLLLAGSGGEVTGVDIIPEAIEDARAAAARNGVKNAAFVCADAGQRLELRPDLVIVDPPRKGLSDDAINTLTGMAPDRGVYISCDPTTLARDVKTLSGHGYRPERMTAADLFPGTAHVETVVLLSKLKSTTSIEVKIDLDEMDLTAAESKATYDEIKQYVLDKFGYKVSQLYIAQVKRKYGIIERDNYNVGDGKTKVPQVPADKEKAIEDALRNFQMI